VAACLHGTAHRALGVLVNAVCVSVQAELAVEAWSAAGEELLNVAASTSDRPTTSSAKLGGRRNPLAPKVAWKTANHQWRECDLRFRDGSVLDGGLSYATPNEGKQLGFAYISVT
jgi:hypothetical protein